MSTDSAQSEAVNSTGNAAADKADAKACSAVSADGKAAIVSAESAAKIAASAPKESPGKDAASKAVPWWRKTETWAGGMATIAVAGALAGWLATLLSSVAAPRTSDASISPVISSASASATPINPGHLPGAMDVSTMAPHHQFYAVPNFYFLSSCGRPCWLPAYQQPTEQSAFVTDGWPCEYYGPNNSSEPSCTQAPAWRTTSEIWDPANRDSGDKILVVCQLRQLGNGQAAPTIRNQVGQGSHIWDMVAVPASGVSPDSPAARELIQVPHMPGFHEAFAPDIWLGNTGWHDIPCP